MDATIHACRGRFGRRLATTSAVLALALLGADAGSAAQARTPDPSDRRARVQSQLAAARDDLADLSEQAAASVRRLQATQTELARARARLGAATAELAQANQRARELAVRLRNAQAREAAGLAALARNAEETDVAEERRDTLARLAYESGGSGELVALVSIASARDLADRAYVVQEVSAHTGGVIDELEAIRQARLIEQAALADARREVAQLTLLARAAADQAAYARSQQAASTAELTSLAATQAAQQRDVQSRKAAEQARVDSLEAESDRLTQILRAQAAARAKAAQARQQSRRHSVSRSAAPAQERETRQSSGATLAYPVGAPITSGFGMRFHPILNYARLHAGVDFGAPCGTPVRAAASGDVVRAGWAGGYGNQIVVAHDGPVATSYSHLSSIAVSGGHVQRGQLIGHVGTTGLSTGCHLHFEARVNGSPVDPRRYF